MAGKRTLIGEERRIDGKIYHLYVTTTKGRVPFYKAQLQAEGWNVRLRSTYTDKSGQKHTMIYRRKK